MATETETDTGSEGAHGDGGGKCKGKGKERDMGPERVQERDRKGLGGRDMEEESDRPPKFLAIHEWASVDAFETKQYRRATDTPWRTEVLKEGRVLRYEIRVFRAA